MEALIEYVYTAIKRIYHVYVAFKSCKFTSVSTMHITYG